MRQPRVSTLHTNEGVFVIVRKAGKASRFRFDTAPGGLTVDELRDVLDALGVSNEQEYRECDCADRSWYGEYHDTECPCHGLEKGWEEESQ